MDTIRLQQLIDSYVEKYDSFKTQEHKETYKWSAISHFQKYWDLDEVQFGRMFKTAFEDSVNQIDVPSFQPVGGVIFLCKQGTEVEEKVRGAFRNLMEEEDSDIQNRVDTFVRVMNGILQESAPEKWKYHQDVSSALLFLSCADPDNNYMYAESEVRVFARYLGVENEIYRNEELQIPEYYRMCDEVAAELQQQPDLLQLISDALETVADETDDSSVTEVDGENHILVWDLIYCARHYDLYEDADAASNQDAAPDEEIEKEEQRIRDAIQEAEKKKKSLEKKRAKLDLPDLSGKEIGHARYGSGVVAAQEGKYLSVLFGGDMKKKFVLPDAVTKGFLKLDDEGAVDLCKKITEADGNIQAVQRKIELLNIELNGYGK
ncbi:MAG: hypothetical protein HUJ73_01010 [Eubacterium sp.]|nr:hypothetical protein [Eubacterium sp.]